MSAAAIACWGSHAERFVARHTSAALVAIFARSLHLEADGDFICIGDASIGNGPLNATVDTANWAGIACALPAVGSTARIETGTIRIGDAIFNAASASTWRPPSWPPVVKLKPVAVALDNLTRHGCSLVPADGVARIVLGSASTPISAVDRIAQPRVRRLRQWARAHLSESPYAKRLISTSCPCRRASKSAAGVDPRLRGDDDTIRIHPSGPNSSRWSSIEKDRSFQF